MYQNAKPNGDDANGTGDNNPGGTDGDPEVVVD